MYYVNPNLVNLHRIVYQNNRKDYLRLDLNENPGGLPQDFIDEVLEGITPQYVSQYPETYEFESCLSEFLGVKNENIEVAGMCSVCHPDLFFSYRREGEKAGRFGAGIGMKS